MQNPVLAADVFSEIGIAGIERGQYLDAPPAVVFVRIVFEPVPRKIRRFFRLIRADGIVFSVTVEVTAVIPCVIEHTVADDADSDLLRFLQQIRKCRISAEGRIDRFVISCIVLVVGISTENRRKIDDRHTERLQIRQLFGNTPQVPAEKFVVFHLSAGTVCMLGNPVIPIVIVDGIAAPRHIGMCFTLCKTIDENMVHNPAAKRFRCTEAVLRQRPLKGMDIFVLPFIDRAEVIFFFCIDQMSVPGVKFKAEIEKSALLALCTDRSSIDRDRPDTVFPDGHLRPQHDTVVITEQTHPSAHSFQLRLQRHGKGQRIRETADCIRQNRPVRRCDGHRVRFQLFYRKNRMRSGFSMRV